MSDRLHIIRLRPGNKYADIELERQWTVSVFCQLTKTTTPMAWFVSEDDAIDYAHDKAAELGVAWERK